MVTKIIKNKNKVVFIDNQGIYSYSKIKKWKYERAKNR